jgi:hypothetical protein
MGHDYVVPIAAKNPAKLLESLWWSFPLARGRSERPMGHATCKSSPGFAFTVMVCCEEIPTYDVETER